jgi:threonine dehydrogenase-like Zn-dependent dehydrogenase
VAWGLLGPGLPYAAIATGGIISKTAAADYTAQRFPGFAEQLARAKRWRLGCLVVAPFTYCDGTCPNCRAGWPSNCAADGSFGSHGVDGGQGEAVRVPFADATLVDVPGTGFPDDMLRSLLALSDMMRTGHHAAVSAGVKPGDAVAVIGDGAVGLCAVSRQYAGTFPSCSTTFSRAASILAVPSTSRQT